MGTNLVSTAFIQNNHDLQLAALGGFNCNGNKSTLAALSTYTGASAIGNYPPIFGCCGGSMYGINYGAYALGSTDMSIIGPKSYYAADTVESFNNYSNGIEWGDVFNGGCKSITMGAFEGLTAAASNPQVAINAGSAALKGIGSIFSNIGNKLLG